MASLGSIGVNGQAGVGTSTKARVTPISTSAVSSPHQSSFRSGPAKTVAVPAHQQRYFRSAQGYRGHASPLGNYFPVPLDAMLPTGFVATAYSTTITAQGGTNPYAFTLTAGALPAGLSFNGSTGVISGTPTTAAAYGFTIRVTDANGVTGSTAFNITVVVSGGSGNSGFSN